MRRLSILTFFLIVSCSDSKDKLFKTLHQKTFIPRDGVTINFIDSTSYQVEWGPDSARKSETKLWTVETRLTGTYLILDSSEMRLETLSDSVITFSKGEFNPRFELKN
jgi:hypothetical protein